MDTRQTNLITITTKQHREIEKRIAEFESDPSIAPWEKVIKNPLETSKGYEKKGVEHACS